MDVTFSNVLEGTRQYFMGLPKQAAGETPAWAAPSPSPAPAQSGAPTPSAPPPSSAAAAPPPPRPPSEPIEPEPHIIHKATVMREAAEKRRERPEPEDDDEAADALSPPPHIIRRPPLDATPVSAPPRPPSKAPTPVPPSPVEMPTRGPTPRGATPVARPPEHFTPARPPDPYSASRPPEPYTARYYDTMAETGRPLAPLSSPQPPPRHGSPQTYARMSSSLPAHTTRLREGATHSPPAQRYSAPPPPPHNDRVPPIHHPPQSVALPQRVPSADARSAHYASLTQRREESAYSRAPHYERHPQLQQRKYDPQQAYPGYRPAPTAPQPVSGHRIESHHTSQFKHATLDPIASHSYPTRPIERVHAPPQSYPHDSRHSLETARRPEYPSMTRPVGDTRSGYHYPTPSTSSTRYAPNAPSVPGPPTAPSLVVQSSSLPPRPVPRPAAAPKSNYEYPTSNHVQTSPARSAVKSGYPNQQARMTVSVTSLVNQMNQTKQKRESPLDLSVKTVKNSADSSTTQDDVIDSASAENKTLSLQPRPVSSNSRHVPTAPAFESHKVDFAPNFTQYRDRNASHSYPAVAPPGHHPVRYNGGYEAPRPPAAEPYPVDTRHHTYPDRSKYSVPVARADYVPRIDLTRPVSEERRPDNRIRDDRHYIIEERKRPAGPIVSNIPEKIVRYETWSADSRIDRMSQSAREQHELMSRPVYSYSSHKQFEAYQNEQKRLATASAYREHHTHVNHRYQYPTEAPPRERHDYHAHHHDRNPSSNTRHIIQKIPSHRDIQHHHVDPHSGMPADKRVLSILRNSLETKQTGFVEPARPARQIPDLIVIDDVDDSVIEITDLTKDNEVETPSKLTKPINSQNASVLGHHIQMPKAIDSIPSDYQRLDNSDSKNSSENDVTRIRTKGELKVLPPSDHSVRQEPKQNESERVKILPKSQKQHLFNQIREDMRLESVIKSEKFQDTPIPEVKSEPMNIEEIERDAMASVRPDDTNENLEQDNAELLSTQEPEDLDWAFACDSFMEQLKTSVHKKKQRKQVEILERDGDNKIVTIPKVEPTDSILDKVIDQTEVVEPPIVIKQEPVDEEEIRESIESPSTHEPQDEVLSENNTPSTENTSSSKEKTGKKKAQAIRETEEVKEKTNLSNQEVSNKKELSTKKSLTDTPEKEKGKGKKSIKNEKTKLQGRTRKSLSLQEEKEKIKTKKSCSTREGKEKSSAIDEKVVNKDVIKKAPVGQEKKDDNKETAKTPNSEEKKNIDKEKPKSSKTQDKNEPSKEKTKRKRSATQYSPQKDKKLTSNTENNKIVPKKSKANDKSSKDKTQNKTKTKSEKNDALSVSTVPIKKEIVDEVPLKVTVKEEPESTDDDEPLIKSKILKEKEMRYQLLKDLSEKSAYVKLECFDVDLNKNTRISTESLTKEKDEKQNRKITRQSLKNKEKIVENHKNETKNDDSSSNSDDEDLSVASRLRVRKSMKSEDSKVIPNGSKTPVKSTPKKQEIASNSSTPLRKPGFGDGSDFHPGWEEELYRYKRSLRMPTRLIAIPRGRSGGPYVRGSGGTFTRGSTSLPDLDPAPLSPAPSSAPSAVTDADLYTRRQDKLTLDSDLESNSSYSATNRLHYDSEASTSTVFSSKVKKNSSSIVDVLIQKCGKRDESKKKSKDKDKDKDKDEKIPKIIQKSSNPNELLPTPSLGLIKNGNKGSLSAKKEKLMEDIFYLGAFRKETVTAFRNAFIKNTDGLIGATEEFAPVVLKSRTRTESRVLKQRATIKEVFGDERPASAPPTSCRDEEDVQESEENPVEPVVEIKKEPEPKPKMKSKKIIKDKLRRSSSIRDGLRSTKSLKRNDAKGRLMRLKKRNSLMKSLASKRMKELSGNKIKKEKSDEQDEADKPKEETSTPATVDGITPPEGPKRRFKRLFGRRKFSSGFDYIRKKKKIIRREDTPNNKVIRRPAVKPSPESENDIQKEIKGWFINKSVGETHLHRAARLGYTDCVAYCLEKMEADPSAKDNAGFTPLHVAAAKGHVRIARLLLQYGANVSAAANGGIRPLHEACENCHVEVIRLLLSYGADPLLGTYAGQTPEELTEGPAVRLLRLHITDVQGQTVEPWKFPPPAEIIDKEELGCDPLSSPPPGSPPPPPDSTIEIQCTEAPLPPFYSLKTATGQPTDGLWCLLQDITNFLQIKSKDSLLKQIHCGSGSPKELLKEIRTQEFLERAQCHQLLCAGEKVNVRASKVSLVRVTDKLRQLLKIETVLIS